MGVAGYIEKCCSRPDLFGSMNIQPDKVDKNVQTSSNQETAETNEIKSLDNKNINKISHYEGFTSEELAEINEKININYTKYQKMPLKSSDINIIYKSGVIRSNSFGS